MSFYSNIEYIKLLEIHIFYSDISHSFRQTVFNKRTLSKYFKNAHGKRNL